MSYNNDDEDPGYPDFEYHPPKPADTARDDGRSPEARDFLQQGEAPPENDYARFQPKAAPVPVASAQPEVPPVAGMPFQPEAPPVAGMPFQPETPPIAGTPFQPETAPVAGMPFQPEAPPIVGMPFQPETPPVAGMPFQPETPPIVGMPFQPETPPAYAAPPLQHPIQVQAPNGAGPYVFKQAEPVDALQGAPGDRQGVPEWSLRRRGDAVSGEWREPSYSEPSYSEPHDSTYAMYTPGISVNQPYSRKRVAEAEPEHKERPRSGRLGRFARAALLVLLCVSLSAAAAYAGVGYRISRGDFDVVNQVVLGGASSQAQQADSVFTVAATEGGMTPQDIYEMALTQVVGINISVPSMGAFGSVGSSTVSGSGFIISADGYILTNFHVIESAQQSSLPVSVVLNDGTEFDARIIGYDKTNDVALLKINATGLNPAVIANSNNIRVGQAVYAVGNPFGDLVYTMTDGIVSALDRIVTVDSKDISTFQFSAAVNSGNSGGPVYDKDGEVIGIVTAKLMRGSVEGIGFAIPINDAIEIASGLIEHGYIAGRPLIGIVAQTANSGHAEYFGWVVGAYIRSVTTDSAAERAGLMVGDIITAIGGVEVDSMESLRVALRRYRAGDTTTITVWRSGEDVDVSITFDEDLSAGQPEQQQQLPQQQQQQQQQPRLLPPQQDDSDQEQGLYPWQWQVPWQGDADQEQEQGLYPWQWQVPWQGDADQEQEQGFYPWQWQIPQQDDPDQEQGLYPWQWQQPQQPQDEDGDEDEDE